MRFLRELQQQIRALFHSDQLAREFEQYVGLALAPCRNPLSERCVDQRRD